MSRTIGGGTQITVPLKKYVKRHFLESELKTADDLIAEYTEYAEARSEEESASGYSATRHKLIWLLERLQEEVL